jgi:AcrR family transcriptional regulator
MSTRHEKRSEETKKNIILAAQNLFSNQGYDGVTMRQIAKAAGCSHTTIYIYFKDKEELLHHLAMPLLQELSEHIKTISNLQTITPDKKLIEMSRAFIRFSLENKNIYAILIVTGATRVDQEDPEFEVNKVRLDLFKQMRQTIQASFLTNDAEQILAFARIFFYTLHGIITTYISSKESYTELIGRLGSTFDQAVEVLLSGFKAKSNLGGDLNEG